MCKVGIIIISVDSNTVEFTVCESHQNYISNKPVHNYLLALYGAYIYDEIFYIHVSKTYMKHICVGKFQ